MRTVAIYGRNLRREIEARGFLCQNIITRRFFWHCTFKPTELFSGLGGEFTCWTLKEARAWIEKQFTDLSREPHIEIEKR